MKYVDVSRHNHSVGNNIHHFEWCTKYRYKMFRKEKYKTLCERVLREVADRHGIEIRELSVLPDHIHIVAAVPPTMAPVKAEQLLKGASAYKIFREAPKFRFRYPRGHLWSPGKFHNSVGYADLDTVEKYVRSQVEKHGVTFL